MDLLLHYAERVRRLSSEVFSHPGLRTALQALAYDMENSAKGAPPAAANDASEQPKPASEEVSLAAGAPIIMSLVNELNRRIEIRAIEKLLEFPKPYRPGDISLAYASAMVEVHDLRMALLAALKEEAK